MQGLMLIVSILCAYLIGSIPTALWVGKWFYKIDIREHGSGNSGATNTIRVLGVKPGLAVLIFDAFKGFLAVKLFLVFNLYQEDSSIALHQIGLGMASVFGHIFPVYAGFRGGKGIATMLGLLIGFQPWAALICVGVFLVVFSVFRYVSLGSISSAIAYPFVVYFVLEQQSPVYLVFSIMVCVMVVATHRKNIRRLIDGKESKIQFRKK